MPWIHPSVPHAVGDQVGNRDRTASMWHLDLAEHIPQRLVVRLRVDPLLRAGLPVPLDRHGELADGVPVGAALLGDPLLTRGTGGGLGRLEPVGDRPLDPERAAAPAVVLGLPIEPRLSAGRACHPALVAELLKLGAALGELVLDVDVPGVSRRRTRSTTSGASSASQAPGVSLPGWRLP